MTSFANLTRNPKGVERMNEHEQQPARRPVDRHVRIERLGHYGVSAYGVT